MCLTQQSTIKDLLLGPSDVYADATLRVSLKSKAVVRAVQAHVRWQVLAEHLDGFSRSALKKLTPEEVKKRDAARPLIDKCIRGFFGITGVLFLDLYSCRSAYLGVNPWDRTYRKPEWEGRTLVEQVLHRLWIKNKIEPMRQNRDPAAVMAATPRAPGTPRAPSRSAGPDLDDAAGFDGVRESSKADAFVASPAITTASTGSAV